MYIYQQNRNFVFTEEGVKMLLSIRDNVHRLLSISGAFKMINAWEGITGETDHMTACVDMLVERGEIIEIKRECAGQYRVFIKS